MKGVLHLSRPFTEMVCQHGRLWVARMAYDAGNGLRFCLIGSPHLTALVPHYQWPSPWLHAELHSHNITRVIRLTHYGI